MRDRSTDLEETRENSRPALVLRPTLEADSDGDRSAPTGTAWSPMADGLVERASKIHRSRHEKWLE